MDLVNESSYPEVKASIQQKFIGKYEGLTKKNNLVT